MATKSKQVPRNLVLEKFPLEVQTLVEEILYEYDIGKVITTPRFSSKVSQNTIQNQKKKEKIPLFFVECEVGHFKSEDDIDEFGRSLAPGLQGYHNRQKHEQGLSVVFVYNELKRSLYANDIVTFGDSEETI